MMATADFTINASAHDDGGFDATATQVLTLALETMPALDSARVQYTVVIASKDAPTLVFSPVDGRPATPTGSVTVTMPGSGVHSYQIQCEVNEGRDSIGAINAGYTRSRIVAIRSALIGARKWIPGESTQYDATGGWVYEQNDLIDDFEAALVIATGATVTVTAGAGLTGGGTLDADRTFNVVANADGSIVVNANDVQVGVLATNAQHGNRGNGALHSVATGAANGFQSAADKAFSDSIQDGSGSPHVAGIEVGPDPSPVGALRLSEGERITVKGLSGTIDIVAHDDGTDALFYGDNASGVSFLAPASFEQAANFYLPIVLPATDPGTEGEVGTNADGRIRMYSNGAVVTAAATSDATAVFVFGGLSLNTAAALRYMHYGYGPSGPTTNVLRIKVCHQVTLSRISYSCASVGSGAATITITLYVNNVATALAVSFAPTDQFATATSAPIVVGATDDISAVVTKTGTIVSPTDCFVSIG